MIYSVLLNDNAHILTSLSVKCVLSISVRSISLLHSLVNTFVTLFFFPAQ